jgi:CRP/FNR family transcriptional regulator, cyclic AMP receptor protein
MNPDQARRVLTENGWLASMPADFRSALLDICQWQPFKAGETIYLAGDPPGGIYGICNGALGMTSALGSALSPVAHLGQPGSWTGLGPLLTGQPRRATIQAITPVLLGYVPLQPLQAMLNEHPQWWLHIAQELLMEFDTVSMIANDLLLRSASSRCAAALLRVANCRRKDPSAGTVVTAPITQSMLAEMTNLSRSRIIPILSEFNQRKLIKSEYRVIWLLDVPGLRAIADAD